MKIHEYQAKQLFARYGVPAVLGMSARVTFLIDGDGRIARVYPAVDPAVHADEVIEAVTAMSGAR